MASSKDPIEVQVLVGPDEGLGGLGSSALQRLPRQTQEVLQSVPSENVDIYFEVTRNFEILYCNKWKERYRGKSLNYLSFCTHASAPMVEQITSSFRMKISLKSVLETFRKNVLCAFHLPSIYEYYMRGSSNCLSKIYVHVRSGMVCFSPN